MVKKSWMLMMMAVVEEWLFLQAGEVQVHNFQGNPSEEHTRKRKVVFEVVVDWVLAHKGCVAETQKKTVEGERIPLEEPTALEALAQLGRCS